MNLFALRREFRDFARLREITTILIQQGFHDLLRKAHVAKHATITSKLIAKHKETTPELARETLEKLGPTFVKLGQVLSLRADLIPHAYCEEFKKLQDNVSPIAYSEIKRIIEKELGAQVHKIFKSIDEKPLAAASISQVHRAKLLTGEDVVIKVQRPGIRDIMARDIDIMRYLAMKIDRHHDGLRALDIVKEFELYTQKELDFTFELRNLTRFYDHFKGSDEIVIPKPYPLHCTKSVLVMEYLSGTPLSDRKALMHEKYNMKKLALLNVKALVEQAFELGIFHADPHPGNLFATRRGKKTALIILDFGIVSYLDEEHQSLFLSVFDSILENDPENATRVLVKLSKPMAGFDKDGLQEKIGSLLSEYQGTNMKEERLSTLVYKVVQEAIGSNLEVSPNIILLTKAFVTMEGTVVWLDENFNFIKEAGPLLEGAMHKQYSLAKLKKKAGKKLREVGNFLEDLPIAAMDVLDKIKEGEVTIKVDEKELARVERMYDIENTKWVLAVVCTGVFIGSTVIVSFAAQYAILGWPVYMWGFSIFVVLLFMIWHFTRKSHRYFKTDDD